MSNDAYFHLFNEVTDVINQLMRDAEPWFQLHGRTLAADPARDLYFALEEAAAHLRRAQQEAEDLIIIGPYE